MKTLEQIKKHCEQKGYTSRACRFNVVEELMGISPEEAKEVETITRYVREIFPKDSVGEAKEKEYHASPSFRREECRLNIELPKIISN